MSAPAIQLSGCFLKSQGHWNASSARESGKDVFPGLLQITIVVRKIEKNRLNSQIGSKDSS
jgi:hypothetical protein